MTTTRIYYEALLDSLEKIVKLEKDDFKSLRNMQKELNKLVKKIQAYKIFELNFSDQFYEYLEADNLNDFTTVQSRLSEELYNALGEILVKGQ